MIIVNRGNEDFAEIKKAIEHIAKKNALINRGQSESIYKNEQINSNTKEREAQ
jgi:hypothetical protein